MASGDALDHTVALTERAMKATRHQPKTRRWAIKRYQFASNGRVAEPVSSVVFSSPAMGASWGDNMGCRSAVQRSSRYPAIAAVTREPCHRAGVVRPTLALDLDLFIGIGNLRRIRFLRSRTQKFPLNSGSHTTQRLKGEGEINVAHPLVREHRPLRGTS